MLQIVEQSPPIEDIPTNIKASIHDLICRGFTVCAGQRPTAAELLKHEAFRQLGECPSQVFCLSMKHIYFLFVMSVAKKISCGHVNDVTTCVLFL